MLIKDYIGQLKASFGGLKELVKEERLEQLFSTKDYVGFILEMQRIMRLDIRIRLGMVNSGGNEAAPAWIKLPQPLPMYGTNAFKDATVTMFLRKNYVAEAGFDSVVCAVAHELSHILLDSVYHSLRREEIAVDLLAMLSGFRDFYVTGSEWEGKDKTPHRQGYMSRDEVMFASHYMTFR